MTYSFIITIHVEIEVTNQTVLFANPLNHQLNTIKIFRKYEGFTDFQTWDDWLLILVRAHLSQNLQ